MRIHGPLWAVCAQERNNRMRKLREGVALARWMTQSPSSFRKFPGRKGATAAAATLPEGQDPMAVLKLWGEMQRLALPPNALTLSAVIAAYSLTQCHRTAIMVYRDQSARYGLRVFMFAYELLLKSALHLEDLDAAFEILFVVRASVRVCVGRGVGVGRPRRPSACAACGRVCRHAPPAQAEAEKFVASRTDLEGMYVLCMKRGDDARAAEVMERLNRQNTAGSPMSRWVYFSLLDSAVAAVDVPKVRHP